MARGFSLPAAAAACWLVVTGSAAAASPTPPFRECPHIGADSGCAILIVIDDHGTQILTDQTQPPYEHNEGRLIGVLNSTTSRTVSSVPLSGASDVFSFDSDGICDPKNSNSPFSPGPPGVGSHSGPCPGNTIDTSGYGGPSSYFTGIDATLTSGTVNFITPLKPGESTYFSLEGAISSTTIDVNVVVVLDDHGIVVVPYEVSHAAGAAESAPLAVISHTDDLHFVVVNRGARPHTFRIFGTTTAAIRPGGTARFDKNAPGKGTFAYASTLDSGAGFRGRLTVR
jgi:hypothetical protein